MGALQTLISSQITGVIAPQPSLYPTAIDTTNGGAIYGGQPSDDGRPKYVLVGTVAPGGDEVAAAHQIAAALRGEG